MKKGVLLRRDKQFRAMERERKIDDDAKSRHSALYAKPALSCECYSQVLPPLAALSCALRRSHAHPSSRSGHRKLLFAIRLLCWATSTLV